MITLISILWVAALLLSWAEHRAAEKCVKVADEYMREGLRSWDKGEACFREAIAMIRRHEDALKEPKP